jgi:enoyl-CoA hydratase
MDGGYSLPFGEAMALEGDLARRHNSALAPAELAARRERVQSKGRSR